MSDLTSSPGSPGGPKMQDRRLSIIQDTAVDDLHDIDTHALDDKSPTPHHESSVMSYMESHSPNDESSHTCIPRSPLLSRSNSLEDEDKVTMVLETNRARRNAYPAPRNKGAADFIRSPSEPSGESHNDAEVKDRQGAVDMRERRKEEAKDVK